MKKTITLSLLLVLLLKLPLLSQTIYWEEEFMSNNGDWTIQDNWDINLGKLMFFWDPIVENFDLSSTSPLITLSDMSDKLIVNQYLDTFSGEDEMAEISILHGTEEDLLWSYAISGGDWGSDGGQNLELSISEYAGQEVQFKFRTFGMNTFNWDYWNIYKISLSALLNTDISVTEITGPNVVELSETNTWSVEVANLGTQLMSDFTLKLFDYTTGNLIGSQLISETLPPNATHIYDFEWTSNISYNTVFYAVVEAEGDEFENNNISGSYFVRINRFANFQIFFLYHSYIIRSIVSYKNSLISI